MRETKPAGVRQQEWFSYSIVRAEKASLGSKAFVPAFQALLSAIVGQVRHTDHVLIVSGDIMQESDVGLVLRELFLVVLKLGAPSLLTAMVVGLLISLFQAVTQINESTLAFVPKVLALGAALMLAGPFMYASLSDYARSLFDRLIAVGGQ